MVCVGVCWGREGGKHPAMNKIVMVRIESLFYYKLYASLLSCIILIYRWYLFFIACIVYNVHQQCCMHGCWQCTLARKPVSDVLYSSHHQWYGMLKLSHQIKRFLGNVCQHLASIVACFVTQNYIQDVHHNIKQHIKSEKHVNVTIGACTVAVTF